MATKTESIETAHRDSTRSLGVLLCIFPMGGGICNEPANYIGGGASYCLEHLKEVDPDQDNVKRLRSG